MDKYEVVEYLGAGSFAVAKLCRHKHTQELVAIKFIKRGPQIDENVAREIINHRPLRHPNVIRFKEVVLTPTHLAIVMEYASGGELFERICNHGRLREKEARYYFQQLITGVEYCHSMQVCHRDLKLDNILLDGSKGRRLKICDFGYSKSSLLHSRPNTTVGSPTYAAPEVLSRPEYDGKMADVWSCGVTLYIMLVAAYPFEDPDDRKNFKKTHKRIMNAQYKIPDNIRISQDCHQLLSRIFVPNSLRRISLKEIKSHPWFLKKLPRGLKESAQAVYYQKDNSNFTLQSVEDITKIVTEARNLPSLSTNNKLVGRGNTEDGEEDEEDDDDNEDEDEDQIKEKDEEEEEEAKYDKRPTKMVNGRHLSKL